MPFRPWIKKDIKLPTEFNPGPRAQIPTRINSDKAHEEALHAWSSIPYKPAYHEDSLAALEGRAPTKTAKTARRTHESTRERTRDRAHDRVPERTLQRTQIPETLCHVMRRTITNYKIRDLTLPKFLFALRRENGPVTGIRVEDTHKFVCASHFVWEMCAALAQNGDDPKWTRIFKMWEPQYAEVKALIASCKGKSRFSVMIPYPPVDITIVEHRAHLAYGYERKTFQLKGTEFTYSSSLHVCDDLCELRKYLTVLAARPKWGSLSITFQHEPWFPEGR
ncbi:uncharacterized protein N7511_003317 [Penicillium nucicola]|uniref:uncharacterized protein n=1 Tax=Penicillium nucicola TaxID=1850975 RepID=UPI002544E91F|nr:uncharacterized protein N7511_003317 [Penicillium nucicola]KAJ5771266.1 hypothetical protein N7511_003317 [Penicillium nucicola]